MRILFEDEHFIAVHKKSGLLVHPSDECRQDKVNLLFQVRDHLGHYVYAINRIDRGVSGIVLFGKYAEIVPQLQEYWHTDKVSKKYLALAHGDLEDEGRFDFELGDHNKVRKEALTVYRRLEQFKSSSYVEVEIFTGRYHQIRRHFSRRMHALLGDRKYGKKKWNDEYLEKYQLERIFLHAHSLSFQHPLTEQMIEVSDVLPEDLQRTLSLLRS